MTFTYTNIDIVALVGAVVGPFLAVIAAQALARRDEQLELLRTTLREIGKDALVFQHRFMARHPECFIKARSGDQVLMGEVPQVVTVALLESTANLNNDVLALGLLLGNEDSKPVGSLLQTLISRANLLLDENNKQHPSFDACKKGLDHEVTAIHHAMKPLWDKAKKRSWWKFWKA